MKGTVLKSTGSHYQVYCEDGNILDCRVRGQLRLKGIKATNPVAVGDKVTVLEDAGGTGTILDIDERKNYIIRKSTNLSKQVHVIAANIDHAYLVTTVVYPKTKLGFIDRFLVTAEAYHIPVTIIFNKKDLYDQHALELLDVYTELYERAGYEVICLSAMDEKDIDRFRARLTGQINLFSGHSGVGKSTLINAIEPGLQLKTSHVSTATEKGMHTTTFAEMFPLTGGGYLIDTPGIKEFGVVDLEKEEVSHYFPEMRKLLPGCKFNNCTHINEPGCAVKQALEDGLLAITRYESYLNIFQNREEEEDTKYD